MIRRLLLITSCVSTLTACVSTPNDHIATLPQLTYDHLVQIPVNVSRIDVDTNTQRAMQAWDVSNSLTTSPDTAMRRYLKRRFKANGQDGILKMTLSKAEIKSASVPNENKLLAYLSLANVTDYTMEVVVDIESLYNSGQPDSTTSTRFVRKTRMPIDVTLAYREARLQKTLEEIIRDIDEAMITTLSSQFNLIAQKDIPAHNIAVKTDLPEHEGKLDIWLDEVKGNIDDAKTTVGNSFPDTTIEPRGQGEYN